MKKIITLFLLLPIINSFQIPFNKAPSVVESKRRNIKHFNLNFDNDNGTTIFIPIPMNNFRDDDYSEAVEEYKEPDNKFNFTHIGGYNEVKKELLQMKEIFDNYKKYEYYNVRIPRGILLEGPPGNGKTLLAKCFAGECKYNFIPVSGSEFNEKYVGVGASRMRDLFERARRNQPAIIFIDEIDVIGGKRVIADDGSGTERYQTLNQLLVLMDGYNSYKDKIFIIGATNRKDVLDEALLRSGRFDKIIHIPNPDADTRKEIIKIHRGQKPIDKTISNDDIGEITSGLSGADIENVLNEATLLALRKNKIPISYELLEQTRDKILFGETNQDRKYSKELLEKIAIHECGHLLASLFCKNHAKATKISISSSNPKALGYTFFHWDDKYLYSETDLDERIFTLFGGYIAEKIFFGEVSSGAVDDIKKIKILSEDMIIDYLMTDDPLYSYNSDEYKRNVDDKINTKIKNIKNNVFSLIIENKNLLHYLSTELINRKTISNEQLSKIIEVGLFIYPNKDLKNF